MDEARFVLKCFLFAALLITLSQLKTKTGTIETQIQATLVSSETASLVNKVADGGVKAIRDLGSYLRSKISAGIQGAPAKEEVQDKAEAAVADAKKAIQKIEASVKTAVTTAEDELEEAEEIE
jgi:hypothetical protein